MRVCIFTPRYPPTISGGGEISTKLLADQLHLHPDIDHVGIFSFDGRGKSTVDGVDVQRFGTPPHAIPELANLYAGFQSRRFQTALAEYDIIHAYNMALNPVAGYLSRKLNLPSVATLNSYDILPKSTYGTTPGAMRRVYELTALPTTGRILDRYTREIDTFVALSEASRDVFRANGFSDESIEVIPNMLDPSFDLPSVDEPEYPNRFVLLFVGSLIPEKGTSHLIRAMTHLPDDVLLRLVGSGKQGPQLNRLSRELGVDDRISFEGSVPYDDIGRYYATADLFVHPGVWPEPFGRTILEAMQAGLPVVSTDTGGPAEIIPNAELLCEPGDPKALSEAIERARDRCRVLGRRNRTHVHQKYAPDVVIPQILSLYEEIRLSTPWDRQ